MHLGDLQSRALWVRVGGRGIQMSSAPVVDGSLDRSAMPLLFKGLGSGRTAVTRRKEASALGKSSLWQEGRWGAWREVPGGSVGKQTLSGFDRREVPIGG
jgi:hypothetical protein